MRFDSSRDRASATCQLRLFSNWTDVLTKASSPTAIKSLTENPNDILLLVDKVKGDLRRQFSRRNQVLRTDLKGWQIMKSR